LRSPWLGVFCSLFALSCSTDSRKGAAASTEEGADALIVPAGLAVSALPGGNGVLELVALTLRQGVESSELYAALKNTGETPACSAALSVELFDENGLSLASGINGLLSQHFYRRSDGSGALAACIAPGDVAMAAIRDLPAELVIDDVRSVVYRCPYFALEVEAISGLSIHALKRVRSGSESAFTGTLRNELDVAVRNPSVTIFPLNFVGRPLAVVMANADVELQPGGAWGFETDAVSVSAHDFVAYPAGALQK
jgi:hypothetical protein